MHQYSRQFASEVLGSGAHPSSHHEWERKKGTNCIIEMVQALDAGPLLNKEAVSIGENETFEELEVRLIEVACRGVLKTIEQIANSKVVKEPQDEKLATYAQKLSVEEERIDWKRSAREVHNLIRAFSPQPGAWCKISFGNTEKRMKIYRTEVLEDGSGSPGQVLEKTKNSLIVACGCGAVKLLEVQIEGKRPMQIKEFFVGGAKQPARSCYLKYLFGLSELERRGIILPSNFHRGMSMSRSLAISQNNPVGPTVDQVALDYLKTGSGVKNMVFKSATSIFDSIALFSSNPEYKKLAMFSKDAKNFSELASVPNATLELTKRITAYAETGGMVAFGDLVREIFSFLVPTTDSIKALSSQFIPLSARTIAIVGTVGSTATLVSMSFGIDEEFGKKEKAKQLLASEDLQKAPEELDEKEKAQKNVAEAQIDNCNWVLARNAHYAALGAFGLAATILKRTAPPPLMVALAAGGVVFSILSHFNAQLYLEPAKDAQKKLLERDYV